LTDLFFGEIEYRVAAGALVACVDQRIEREGVIFGGGDLFFDEGAEDAELMGREMHGYKGATGRQGAGCRDDNERKLCRLTSCCFSMKIRCGKCCRMTTWFLLSGRR